MYFTISTNWTSYRWPTPSQSIKGRDRNSRQWSCLWPCSITSSCSGTWFTPQRRGAGDSWFWSARERRSQSPFATIVPRNDFQAYTTDLSQAKVDPCYGAPKQDRLCGYRSDRRGRNGDAAFRGSQNSASLVRCKQSKTLGGKEENE